MDRRHWYYLGDRRPFIDLGAEDSWKPHTLRMVNRDTVGGPVVKGDELWFYYIGASSNGPKGGWINSTSLAFHLTNAKLYSFWIE